eukprot:14959503-Alexandrium_andersonii.AAC.1
MWPSPSGAGICSQASEGRWGSEVANSPRIQTPRNLALGAGDVRNFPKSIPHRPFSAAAFSAFRKATTPRTCGESLPTKAALRGARAK